MSIKCSTNVITWPNNRQFLMATKYKKKESESECGKLGEERAVKRAKIGQHKRWMVVKCAKLKYDLDEIDLV